MAVIRTNQQNQVYIWGETALGTRPAPVTKANQLSIIGHDLGRVQTLGKSRVLRGDPNMAQPPRGRFQVQGRKLSMPFQAGMTGLLLYKFLSSYGVAGAADPYTHTMKLSAGAFHAAGPYFGLQVWDNEAVKGDTLDGCVVKGVELDINTEDTEAGITFEIWGIGKGDFGDAALQDATPVTYTDAYWNMADAKIKVDGAVSDYVVSGHLALSRYVSVRSIPDGNRYAKHLILGGVESASVSLTGLFEDAATVRALATGEAEHAIAFEFYHPTTPTDHSCIFTLPEVMAYLTNVPAVGEGNEREVTVEGVSYYQNGADATSLKVVLKDALATYVGVLQ